MIERKRFFYAHDKFEKGVMPEFGGLIEQSAHWIEAFQVIDDALAGVAREKTAAQEAPDDGD